MSNFLDDDFDENALFSQEAIAAPVAPAAPAPASSNPLAAYYRQPGISITLPSKGAFNAPGDIHFNMDGTVSVRPMTAADEMIMSSPDALMSGFAIEELFRSCVPGVKNPRDLPSVDVEALMLAIRSATYGDMMEIEPVCPECGREHSFDIKLANIMSGMVPLPDDMSVRINDDLVAHLRPVTLAQTTHIGIVTFEETRKAQIVDLNPEATDAARSEMRNGVLKRLTELNKHIVANCIVKIETPGGVVDQPELIADFVKNAPITLTAPIDRALKMLNNYGIDTNVAFTCEGCGHEWKSSVELNPANFSGRGSAN